jgi:hypothetical protein
MIKVRYIKSQEREVLFKKIKIIDNKMYMIYGIFLKQRLLFLLDVNNDTISELKININPKYYPQDLMA